MTATTRKEQEKAREIIEKATEKSVMEAPAPVNEIARITGYPPSTVLRVYYALGWRYKGGRWVWKHNAERHE